MEYLIFSIHFYVFVSVESLALAIFWRLVSEKA